MRIDELQAEDWPACARIYEAGLDVGTFEETVPSWEEWDASHLASPQAGGAGRRRDPRLGGAGAGLAAGVLPRRDGELGLRGAGRRAAGASGRRSSSELVRRADAEGVWTIQAGILAGNDASVALHERCGFRVVGTRERIAQKRGEWRDVVLMERRAP